jgi:hypothetical protein
MKKLVLLLSLITVFAYSKTNAQMKMSGGNVDINSTPAPNAWTKLQSVFTVSGTANSRYYSIAAALTNTSYTNMGYGISGTSYSSTALTNGRSYGVYGLAGNCTSGYNYGVYGTFSGNNNGAGVFGTTNGDVNVSGNWAGFFYGNVKITNSSNNAVLWVNSTQYTSDKRLKKNIKPISNNDLEKISQLSAVQFQFKTRQELMSAGLIISDDTTKNIAIDTANSKKYRFGYLAQDVQQIYPDIVYQSSDGFYGIDYVELIPLMMEAIKQQSKSIAKQDSTISSLQQQLNNCCTKATKTLNKAVNQSEGIEEGTATSSAILYQNIPNPFSQQTQIKCFIPDGAMLSNIFIYDMQGTQMRKIQINGNGNQSITIQGSELKAGMYMYTLIIDGKEIGTKKMILTD